VKDKKTTYNYISKYLIEVLSKGRFTITFEELKNQFDVSDKALLQNLFRLKAKNQIAQIRKEFYAIIPPQYSIKSMLPPYLFIDDMMKYLKKDYYVGLFSAAALHGASHQQPMQFQVITPKPALRNIIKNKLHLLFYTKENWEESYLIQKKTEAGYIKISSPELTSFDLVHYHKQIGGINRILPILETLTETLKPSLLSKIALTQKNPDIQRLGFLLEAIGNYNLSNSLHKVLEKPSYKELPLSLNYPEKVGEKEPKWKLRINTDLDLE
jgi:predicted transcriptional regulator of viral defense system